MHEFMPLEPFLGFLQQKLIFWVFSHHFGALKRPLGFAPHTLHLKLVFLVVHSISYPHLTYYENQYRVHLMHKFIPPKLFLVLSQRTCPIHYFRSKSHVLGG